MHKFLLAGAALCALVGASAVGEAKAADAVRCDGCISHPILVDDMETNEVREDLRTDLYNPAPQDQPQGAQTDQNQSEKNSGNDQERSHALTPKN
jgi:hypothetical protein